MKQRVLSAIVALVILAIVLSLFDTLVLNAAVAAVAVFGLYEFFHATKIDSNKALCLIGYAAAAVIPFIPHALCMKILPAALLPAIGLFFCILLATHRKTPVEHIAMTFMISLAIPLSMASAIYMRDTYGMAVGMLYLGMSLGGAWFSDTGAYFVGCAIGKHKLAPMISPKKTWEGVVGGIVVCLLGMLLLGKVFELLIPGAEVNYLALAVLAPFASVISIIGDLSASLVKRQFGIKDFGNIMPGHGGVLDRFDSVLFVLPLVWGIVQNAPIVTIL